VVKLIHYPPGVRGSVVPIERIAEFVDGPLNGVLEVEPITPVRQNRP
jgi:hypothetical protein